MKVYSNIEATVVIADLRNFTHLYEEFQKKEISVLLTFMEDYYTIGLELADLASYDFNYYVNSTGDGLLITFFWY